jgi:hypothetical protein
MPPADTSPQDSAALRTKAPELDIPTVLTRWQTVSVLARVVRSRFSGALTFEEAAGIRRVVVHDGDFVTVASGVEGESLISFLAERGDIAAETASHLGPRLPHFGRHAGAALIAHGHLRQDELWVVLRAHAEWLLGHIVLMSQGTASVDQEVPSRLQAEPAVFGGAPGAEVLVEIVRRVLPTQEALRALGGPRAQLLSGAYHHLLRECGLDDAANLLLEEIDGFSVGEAIARSGSPSFATVLYAIRELGIEEVRTDREGQAFSRGEDSSALDDEAVRRRVQARLALVEEADYFALLGVGRNATLHDVQRAYLALRTQFDPARVLSARTADLAGDVETILMVVEEAYEVLGDDSRRDRYRRALEASLH